MARIARVTVDWTGFVGSPGYTNFMFMLDGEFDWTLPAAQAATTVIDNFLSGIRSTLPPTATTKTRQTVEEIDSETGELMAFWTVNSAAAGIGTSAGGYSAAAGACINWATDGIRDGRRVRGRTFIVPLGGAALGTDGTIDTAELTTLQTQASALVNLVGQPVQLAVWGRPIKGQILPVPIEDRPGVVFPVVSATVPDKTAVLTSRRD